MVSLSFGAAQAQLSKTQPAEFPPASYKGKQYVDSTGCVFIRAGIDGNVTWIPRVTRSRKTVCGFKPTQSAAASAPAPSAQPPAEITLAPAVTAAAAAPAPKAVPRRVAPKVRKPAPRRVVKAAPRKVAAPQKPFPGTACPKHSPLGQRYTTNSSGLDIRCGPQEAAIPGVNGAAPQHAAGRDQAEQITRQTRIAPKHVVINRRNTTNVTVPKGYKSVWKDGRLNPRRAEQNLEGRDQMALIWTNTVPRRLINAANGDDVTASVPLVYPYTSVAQQRRGLGEVTIVQRNGKKVKKIVRNRGANTTQRKAVLSSRSAPQATAPKVATRSAVTGKRYVQVGVFGQPANAQKAAQRIARMGLPARIGKFRKGGKTLMSVQAGPFKGDRGTSRALQQLRGAGYSDAFARN